MELPTFDLREEFEINLILREVKSIGGLYDSTQFSF